MGQGIVGFVAVTNKPEIIHNVYKDKRFDNKIDKLSGQKTTSMMCIPLIDSDGKSIAVIQLINKRHDHFTPKDLSSFEDFTEIILGLMQS